MSDLYGRFLFEENELDVSELEALKRQLENGLYPEYAERNIRKIDVILNRRKKLKEFENEREERWYKLALEDKRIKEIWESHGAMFINKGVMTKWYLNDECFYTWFSRAKAEEQYPKLLAAHEKFKELLIMMHHKDGAEEQTIVDKAKEILGR